MARHYPRPLFNNLMKFQTVTSPPPIMRAHIMGIKTMFDVVKKGEKARRETVVNGDIATVHHVTLNRGTNATKDSPAKPGTGLHYQLVWTFDFAGVSRAELIDVAAGALTIAVRPGFKTETRGELKLREVWEDAEFSVRDILDETRKRVSDFERVARAAPKLSAAERDELMTALLAMKEAEKQDEEESE